MADPGDDALFCDVGGRRVAVLHFADVGRQGLVADALTASWDAEDDSVVTVTAHALVRDLWLAADRLESDATVDSGLVQLLPGERHRIRITGAVEDRSDGALRRALWSANRLIV